MVVAAASYEECRRQRLEENKKRMEQLNLHKLSQSLKSPKSSPVKKVKGMIGRDQLPLTPVRRSSRMADKPPRSYKEDGLEPLGRARGKYLKRGLLSQFYASQEERIYAIDRAEKLESSLGSEFPCFVKPMLHSHVARGFWLSFPLPFCKAHLPDHDEMVTLVDEDGNEWQSKYLASKNGLSGGWRGFALDHELVDGDALVFQLIKPTTFKVYIIRVNSSEEDEESRDENHEPANDTEISGKKGTRQTRAGKR